MGSRRVSPYNSRATRRTAGSGSKKRSGSRTVLTGQTTGAQPGAYSRCHSFIASSSPVGRPDAASMRRARPVHCAMLPRWPSSTLFARSEEHTSELQSRLHLVCRLLLEKKKKIDLVGDDLL